MDRHHKSKGVAKTTAGNRRSNVGRGSDTTPAGRSRSSTTTSETASAAPPTTPNAPGERFTYFWRTVSPFSNFHRASFTMKISARPDEPTCTHRFFCSEQAFMYCKALFAGDLNSAEAIMAEQRSPTKVKALGRKVRGLDSRDWNAHSKAIMRAANTCKFAQSPMMLGALMATGETALVEAAPNDSHWGIGLDEAHARRTPPERWPGSNRLGRVLTSIREDFKANGPVSEECILRTTTSTASAAPSTTRNAPRERFTYFWGKASPFSNFHRASFTMKVRARLDEPTSTHRFFCIEQAFMYCKALFAGDLKAAEAILAEQKSPTKVKALGRKVHSSRGLDHRAWHAHSKAIMCAVNTCKFAQIPSLRGALMATGDTALVEASPNDRLWGIGLDEANARRTPPERWPGSNRLGRVLTSIRKDFKANGPVSEECIIHP